MSRGNAGLGRFLEERVLPELFERLDQAFPEFGWEPTTDGWVATARETTKRVLDARPERVVCNRPFGFYAHGGENRTWLSYVAGSEAPRGVQFVDAVRRLSELAGLEVPEWETSPEAQRALEEAARRRRALEAVAAITQGFLRDPDAVGAQRYLEQRGLGRDACDELGLGYYPSPAAVREGLAVELHHAAEAAGLFSPRFAGYAVFPWLDAWGRPQTLHFRWAGEALPDGRAKTLALPGAGTKRSPLYLDRARAERKRDLVLVEGAFDAAVLQVRGEAQTVACMAAQLSRGQVETLVRQRVESVTLCLDPDRAGERGTEACLDVLQEVGIRAYVAPPLPEGLDPDEFVLREGIEAWREHVGRAVGGLRYRAERALVGITPQSPDLAKDQALRKLGEVLERAPEAEARLGRDEVIKLAARATGHRASALRPGLKRRGTTPKASRDLEGAPPPQEVDTWPYRADPTGMVWVRERQGRDGPVYEDVPLANFSARITSEVIEDDGAEERRFFEVTADLGDEERVVEVPATQFGSLGWVLTHLGARANLEPGRGLQDRARHAIQALSGTIPTQQVYTHLGWRQVSGRWAYLHAGGAIGAEAVDGVRVRLSEPLDRYALPEPPRGEELKLALQACLRLVRLAPARLTIPLLALPFRAVQGEVDFTAFLYGGSGNHKSCLAALSQQFFGRALHYQNLPGSWLSSANALEGTLFLAKDALFVIDDFIPTGNRHDRERSHRDADRVLRGQGNRAGRQRMRHDATLRPVKRSRALTLCTGEEIPRGESLTARMLVLPVAAGDVDLALLGRCQADADAGFYAQALAGFLRWLAPSYARVRCGLRQEAKAIRAEFEQESGHKRLAGIGADLFLGLRAFARFAEASGAQGADETIRFLASAKAALLVALGLQVESQREADPCRRFFELLSAAMASGRAHVADREGNAPHDASAWGWRLSDEGRAEGEAWRPAGGSSPYWIASGERIGWVDGDDLYLEPSAVVLVAQRMSGEEGFSLSPRTLRRRLREGGHLRGLSAARETTSTRVTLGGARRSVLHLSGSASLWGLEGRIAC